jgi:hypothetical protein
MPVINPFDPGAQDFIALPMAFNQAFQTARTCGGKEFRTGAQFRG